MKGYTIGKPFYQANIWEYNGAGDPLLLEEFTTRTEAVNCIKKFKKLYKGEKKLDCFVSHFDADGFSEYSFDV